MCRWDSGKQEYAIVTLRLMSRASAKTLANWNPVFVAASEKAPLSKP